MDDIANWLTNRRYYDRQLVEKRVTPSQQARFEALEIDAQISSALDAIGIDKLYAHQAEGIRHLRSGDNVVVATETASGKSLIYTIPAFERSLDHNGRALYIAPQNALIADQEEKLTNLGNALPFGSSVQVSEYTGRLSDSEKRTVREQQPAMVLTTPDMLHYALLPYADRLWEWFFASLETVIIDEIHEYRGIFGSHVGLVLRRLARICERFDSQPEFICCSATIGNPIEHASRITGKSESTIHSITNATSEHGPKTWMLWNPPQTDAGIGRRRSNHVESEQLFVDLVTQGLQTLVFTRARQTAERYAMKSQQTLRDRGQTELATKITAYQAALTDNRRRDIENDIKSGDIRGIWSTNALELGIDIGELDVIILDGYPGTRMEAFQQAGRAGRGADLSHVILVAGEDQLDQYLMAHPESFFEAPPENAVINPGNEELLDDHVLCAAREHWLQPTDDSYFPSNFDTIRDRLVTQNSLVQKNTANGPRWVYNDSGSPQHEMSLRAINDREIRLQTNDTRSTIATLPLEDALRDAHPGAVYYHQGQTYEVIDLDLHNNVAILDKTWADYYTQVLTDKEISVTEEISTRYPFENADIPLKKANITLTTQVTGYERKDSNTGNTLGKEYISVPSQTLSTKALYWSLPESIESNLRSMDGDFNGAIHAAEHAVISMYPLHILCDRGDIGGLSTPHHPQTEKSTIFIYDGYSGGVGITETAFDMFEDIVDDTEAMLKSCDCESGCPSCVQSPQCGNANDPLDKHLAITLFDHLSP
ncbi:MAG: DEAD/DEAH box helicase [Halobacteriaceae archaeon]